jgi:hypothetical protein
MAEMFVFGIFFHPFPPAASPFASFVCSELFQFCHFDSKFTASLPFLVALAPPSMTAPSWGILPNEKPGEGKKDETSLAEYA